MTHLTKSLPDLDERFDNLVTTAQLAYFNIGKPITKQYRDKAKEDGSPARFRNYMENCWTYEVPPPNISTKSAYEDQTMDTAMTTGANRKEKT